MANLNAKVLLLNNDDVSNSIFETITTRSAWLKLPFSLEELHDTLVSIGIDEFDPNDPEEANAAVAKAYVSEFKCDQFADEINYHNIFEASDLIERIEDLSSYELDLMYALLEDGETLEEAVTEAESPDDIEWYPNMDIKDLAMQFADEGLFSQEFLLEHIDYESIARDLAFDGYTTANGGVLRRF